MGSSAMTSVNHTIEEARSRCVQARIMTVNREITGVLLSYMVYWLRKHIRIRHLMTSKKPSAVAILSSLDGSKAKVEYWKTNAGPYRPQALSLSKSLSRVSAVGDVQAVRGLCRFDSILGLHFPLPRSRVLRALRDRRLCRAVVPRLLDNSVPQPSQRPARAIVRTSSGRGRSGSV
jgi:hypothetical protein